MNFRQLILVLLSITFHVFLPAPTADATSPLYQSCGKTGNYTANNTYDSNLHTLLKNLTTGATSSSTSDFGVAKSIIGSVPNKIYGIVLCRGDVKISACSSCISQATQDIQNICPYHRAASIFYDLCLLRFSNKNFLSSMENTNDNILYNDNNVSVPVARFDNLVDYLMNSTADYAAFNDTKNFGTSVMNLTDPFPVIRGLAQCTPDMSGSNCQLCLQDMTSLMSEYFSGRQGGRILGVRCSLRYEIYSFYEGAALLTVSPPAENTTAPAPNMTPSTVVNSGWKGM